MYILKFDCKILEKVYQHLGNSSNVHFTTKIWLYNDFTLQMIQIFHTINCSLFCKETSKAAPEVQNICSLGSVDTTSNFTRSKKGKDEWQSSKVVR